LWCACCECCVVLPCSTLFNSSMVFTQSCACCVPCSVALSRTHGLDGILVGKLVRYWCAMWTRAMRFCLLLSLAMVCSDWFRVIVERAVVLHSATLWPAPA
jgi:hypothetical protein